jgi:hypothetical protein
MPHFSHVRCSPDRADDSDRKIGLAYSIISSAVARSEGEIVTLFQKRVSFNASREGCWVSDAWVRLTVVFHRVYGWYRTSHPWIKVATLSAFCSIVV